MMNLPNTALLTGILTPMTVLAENSVAVNATMNSLRSPLIYVQAVFTAVPTTIMCLIVLLLITSLFGTFFYRKHIGRKLAAAQTWPVVEGAVTLSELRENVDSSVRSKRNSITYYAHITYCYSVGGKEYTSGKLNWGARIETSDIESVRAYLNEYPKGKKVPVHYNPAKPSESIVETGIRSNTFIYKMAFIMSCILLLCFGPGFIYMAHQRTEAYKDQVLKKFYNTSEGRLIKERQMRELNGAGPSDERDVGQSDSIP
jgi:hypothetical protein